MIKSLIHYFSCALAAVLLLGSCSKEGPEDNGNNPVDLIAGRWDKTSALYTFGGQVLDIVAPPDEYFSLGDLSGLDFSTTGKVEMIYGPQSYTSIYYLKDSELLLYGTVMDLVHIDEQELVFQEIINRMPLDQSVNPNLEEEIRADLVPVEKFCGKQVYEDKNDPGYYSLFNEGCLLQCWRLPDGKGFYDGVHYSFTRKN